MGGGGSEDIPETEAQKALAEVAQQQWDLYQNELKPYEDLFMQKVENLNSDKAYEDLAGTAALGTAQSFGLARESMADSMAAGGIDPTSGKYQSAMNNLETEQALSQTDTTNRAQSNQQDKYVAGLQDVVAMGQGQKGDALSGYDGLASSSLQKSASDAQSAWEKHQSIAGGLGAVGGAYTANAMRSSGTGYGLSNLTDSYDTDPFQNGTMTHA
ncbi:hypothetical protein [Aeromonas enteropelogenes]|uniref:hypothetical protein n=1 Tax=Aeromonas enteropelogenes TaxID=29489 RepID=UPI003BA1E555